MCTVYLRARAICRPASLSNAHVGPVDVPLSSVLRLLEIGMRAASATLLDILDDCSTNFGLVLIRRARGRSVHRPCSGTVDSIFPGSSTLETCLWMTGIHIE